VRARENAARVIARETLVRFSDYEIDYETGALLLAPAGAGRGSVRQSGVLVAALERMNSGAEHFRRWRTCPRRMSRASSWPTRCAA